MKIHNCNKYQGFNSSSINSQNSLNTNVNNNHKKTKFPTIIFTSSKLIQKNKVNFYPGSPHLSPFLLCKGNSRNVGTLIQTSNK